jgi:hypothetical protein
LSKVDAKDGATPPSAVGGHAVKPSRDMASLYFAERLIRPHDQRHAVALYRDKFRLLFTFAQVGLR